MSFQKLLLDVEKSLGKDEERSLVFLCTDLLRRNPASVETASDLFSLLGDRDLLSAEKPHLLTELLLIIERKRLIKELKLPDGTPTSLISSYRKLLYKLSENITEYNLKDIKFLIKDELPRKKLEENVTTLEVFLELEQKALISDVDLKLLEDVFWKVCPILNKQIDVYKAQQAPEPGTGTQETGRLRAKSLPLDPNQVRDSETTSSFGESRPRSLVEAAAYSPNTSVGFQDVSHADAETLSTNLSELNMETTPGTDATTFPTQERVSSSGDLTSQMMKTKHVDLGAYPMTAAKRGICLIVNNHDFTDVKFLNDRPGTDIDRDCLKKVFEWLGFVVEIHNNCDVDEMLSVFQELGRRDHSAMSCVVCCVLSHGEEGAVYGVDGRTVELKHLKAPFYGSKCASLAGKPKLFFIQACQGTSEQSPVFIQADGDDVCSDAIEARESIPSEADFLLGMSTVPGYASFRERSKGSWYIQSLCQNLVEMVPSGCDLVSILTKVNSDVSQKTDKTGKRKMMPQPSFSLRKRVVFPIPSASPPTL